MKKLQKFEKIVEYEMGQRQSNIFLGFSAPSVIVFFVGLILFDVELVAVGISLFIFLVILLLDDYMCNRKVFWVKV